MFKPSLEVLEDRTMPSSGFGIGNTGSVNTGYYNTGQAAARASAPYVGWLSAAAAQAEGAASQARAAAAAFEVAFPATAPPPVVAANRALLFATATGTAVSDFVAGSTALANQALSSFSSAAAHTPGSSGTGGNGGFLFGNGGAGGSGGPDAAPLATTANLVSAPVNQALSAYVLFVLEMDGGGQSFTPPLPPLPPL